MSLTFWILLFFCVQLIHFAGTWKLYTKAGRKSWEAIVPIYNAYVLMKIIQRSQWWILLLFIPVINLIIFPVIWVETLRSFGKDSPKDTWLGVLTFGLYLFTINYNEETTYHKDRDLKPKNETVSSLLFAVVVATLVHTYVMQPYIIPTSSLEKTLLVGDFLFVSKFHYGARTPSTAVSLPMVHDTIPVLGVKSYLSNLQLPNFRLPAIQDIKRTDIVVFNWPADTVRFFGDRKSIGIRKPIDKKSNYVKRCVGVPGDSLSIVNGLIHINGKRIVLPERAKPQFAYIVTTNGTQLNLAYLKQEFNITDPFGQIAQNQYQFQALTQAAANRIKNTPNVVSVDRIIRKQKGKGIFPQKGNHSWNTDNFGPIYIPEEGKTVAINQKTIGLYKDIIKEYEGNTLTITGNDILINGKKATSYTFKQNYYWMMGDNRHNSEDSRYWGYVPADHIVGKPVFVWMSINQHAKGLFNKIRWERVFTTVGGEGTPKSYFKHFLVLLAIWFGFDYYRKKKREAAED